MFFQYFNVSFLFHCELFDVILIFFFFFFASFMSHRITKSFFFFFSLSTSSFPIFLDHVQQYEKHRSSFPVCIRIANHHCARGSNNDDFLLSYSMSSCKKKKESNETHTYMRAHRLKTRI